MLKNYPLWSSWSSREVYLPAEFHSAKAFDYALSIGQKALGNSAVLEDGGIDAPLLLLGLMYREVSREMEIEPEATSNVPIHLQESPFGIKEMIAIQSLIQKVHLLSKQ